MKGRKVLAICLAMIFSMTLLAGGSSNKTIKIKLNYQEGFHTVEENENYLKVAADDYDGYVILRNIDDEYSNYNGTGDEFIESYIENYVYKDFEKTFGNITFASEKKHYYPNKKDRLATVVQELDTQGYKKTANTVIYYIVFRDGDIVTMAKTYIVDFNNADQLNDLSKIKSGAIR